MDAIMKNSITDFGEKIGGAKKDLFADRKLLVSDLNVMEDTNDLKKFVKKDMIWEKPDYAKMKAEGISIEVIYFTKLVRDSLPAAVALIGVDKEANFKLAEQYIQSVSDIRDDMQKVKTVKDVFSFYNNTILGKYVIKDIGRYVSPCEPYKCIVSNKFLRAVSISEFKLNHEIKKKQFLYTDDEKLMSMFKINFYDSDTHSWAADYYNRIMLTYKYSYGVSYYYPKNEFADSKNWVDKTYYIINKNNAIIANNFSSEEAAKEYILTTLSDEINTKSSKNASGSSRKKKYSVKLLERLNRQGIKTLVDERHITGEDFINDIKIRGGEFGNWLADNDRQINLDLAYQAFVDLSVALNVPLQATSINGTLALAFGARGHGNALAHYEPEKRVINLTKMRGAGSLAHEWGHALDFILSEDNQDANRLICNVKKILKCGTNNRYSNYYMNSLKMSGQYAKCSNGYWQSSEEMFARAFACYVKDKLKNMGYINDYLTGHSEDAVGIDAKTGETYLAVPEGEERIIFNRAFDEMFSELKRMQIL